MGVSIVITSGKGGVGKTTTTANIGTALASLGKRVVVIDGDTGLRNLDVLLGLENRIVYTIIDVIEGRCRLKQGLIKDKRFQNLCLLPTAQTKDKDDISPQEMLKIVNELKEEFDYVLIDSPAGIEQGFENAVIGADKAIVVVNPEITSVRDADRVIGKLDAKGLEDHSVIINRLNYEMTKNGDMLDVSDIGRYVSCHIEAGPVRLGDHGGPEIIRLKIDDLSSLGYDKQALVSEFIDESRHLVGIEALSGV